MEHTNFVDLGFAPHRFSIYKIEVMLQIDKYRDVEAHIHALLEQSEVLFPHEQALILAAAAAALNEAHLLKVILSGGLFYQTAPIAFYEAILQTYLFAGFPAALEGLAVLQIVCKEQHLDWKPPAAARYDSTLFEKRGLELCEQIYTTAYEKMRHNLHATSPDLAEWMIIEGYGKTLSRPQLSPRIRELVVVGVLAVLGWKTQLYSHLRGAMNVGATPVECIDTLNILSFFCERAASEFQPILRRRMETAKGVLEKLLDTTSSL